MLSLSQLDLDAPAPCVEHVLAPAGVHMCRCEQHEACSATRGLSAAELTRTWASMAGLDTVGAASPSPGSAHRLVSPATALAEAAAITTGVAGLEPNMGLLADLVSARDLRFAEALAITLAVMGLEADRAERAA